MNKFIAILGTVAVVAGPAGAALGTVSPEVGAAVAASGGVALAVTKPLLDLQARLDGAKEKRARKRAANR
ncbi:MAG TPA: hypothetical protein VF668_01260 [Pyrinomonadaceae bacterium]|jgi:hypothetical protein